MPHRVNRMVGFVLAIWLLANIVLVGVWDLWVLFFGGETDWLVSHHLNTWAHRFPVGVLAIGILIGHLIWGSTIKDR